MISTLKLNEVIVTLPHQDQNSPQLTCDHDSGDNINSNSTSMVIDSSDSPQYDNKSKISFSNNHNRKNDRTKGFYSLSNIRLDDALYTDPYEDIEQPTDQCAIEITNGNDSTDRSDEPLINHLHTGNLNVPNSDNHFIIEKSNKYGDILTMRASASLPDFTAGIE